MFLQDANIQKKVQGAWYRVQGELIFYTFADSKQ